MRDFLSQYRFQRALRSFRAGMGHLASAVRRLGCVRCGEQTGRRFHSSRGGLAVGRVEVGLFDDADLQFDGHQQHRKAAGASGLDVIRVIPAAKISMAVKMGLRTRANTPWRTNVVVSHRWGRRRCATIYVVLGVEGGGNPAIANTVPVVWMVGACRSATG